MSGQVQAIAGFAQAVFTAAIILLGCGDAGVAHCIFNRYEILAVIQHSRGKGTTQIVRGTLHDPGLALAYLQDMVHGLVGKAVIRQGVKPADTGEKWSVFFPRTSWIHNISRCHVPAGM